MVFYVVNNSSYTIKKLYDFQVNFSVDGEVLCSRYFSSYTIGSSPYSIKKLTVTFTGNSVDPEVAEYYDLRQYLDDEDTGGWFDCSD